ncbi:GntR family transcriptional regulator [Microbacterium sp. ASV49]|uniref:GntR family transcriptional regulator n=1 Tax=Microbacterium candidum TaxID=3041922 RepID=A0ABT7N032_9MICO|nr:GntR family transcriptional regulator [Microbacterium sp. ASV49]MDL9980054.1 GntR family transcriptional regulator [Microbacterium sp. ASV49]
MVATRIERHAAPLRQEVVRQLREDILEGNFAPGERLLENSLCADYGVSRTVVREALRQLESENLITLIPNRGPIVTVLEQNDIESLYEVRAALEALAGKLFAQRASARQAAALRAQLDVMERDYAKGTLSTREQSKEEFYRLLLEGTENEMLASQLQGIHTRIGLFRRLAFVDESRVELSMAELRGIVDAAAVRRDPVAAHDACEQHIHRAGDLAAAAYRQWRMSGEALPIPRSS